ncbi:MAG: 16S rRNA (guanine(966)-N(2))-methyltransferase RsmD [Deltaproteobacteria bacterium]|nr:16S rRNA (guanine(966)-N(2))-methyltransferase RsmD [Deltaproteobacteria bacterium]MBW2205351.1 16S rRNA (guanine(966)-N(2))-methyltransferase RsmD [Deltaproteobacteria bacterium]
MRITGGQMKGRRLASLKGLRIRPSSDLIRQAIFNLIGQDMTAIKVLDLFAGTGSLGIEAISRGAEWVTFVDHAGHSTKLIEKNLRLCGCHDSGVVLRKNLLEGLPLESMKRKFDLVFIDPPYGKQMIPRLLAELGQGEVLALASLVVAEASKLDDLPRVAGRLKLAKTRVHGETQIAIYAYGDSE